MTLYKHQENTDVAIEVLKKYFIPEKDAYSMKVAWVRVSSARNLVLWPLGITQRIEIPREKWLREWEPFPLSISSTP